MHIKTYAMPALSPTIANALHLMKSISLTPSHSINTSLACIATVTVTVTVTVNRGTMHKAPRDARACKRLQDTACRTLHLGTQHIGTTTV